MKKQFVQFLVRVLANALGIFVASVLFSKISYQNELSALIGAALLLALVNAVVRPFVVIFALPAYIITLGLFSIVVNGAMIFLVSVLYGPFEVRGFVTTMLAGIIIGLVNYIVTRLFDIFIPEVKD